MNGNLTLSVRTLVIGLVVLVALVVAYLLGSSGGGSPAAAAPSNDDTSSSAATSPRQLTMTGTGDAAAVPDQLSFALGVHLTRPDLADALDVANRSMTRVLTSLEKYGVAKRHVQTTGLSMDPVYDYPNYGPPALRGYRVSQRARVLVDDLEQGGRAVTAAVAAGGNDVQVDDLKLLVGDTDAVMAQARGAAVEEARAKAAQYAEASGEKLGDVVTISEVRAKPVSTLVEGYSGALNRVSDLSYAMPIRAGRDEASVTVRIVWHLE